MANVWRRQPSTRLRSSDLVRNVTVDARQLIAVGFFEASAPPPPSTGVPLRMLMGVGA
jgi:hypothetical protein